jgi:hypothetical protein
MSHSIVQTLHVDTPAMPRGATAGRHDPQRADQPVPRQPCTPAHPAEEAAGVREMAHRLQATDPGFAADLMVAADRHELLDEIAPPPAAEAAPGGQVRHRPPGPHRATLAAAQTGPAP